MTQINRAEIKETAKSYLRSPLIGGLMGVVGIYLACIFVGGFVPGLNMLISFASIILAINLERYNYAVRITGTPQPVGKLFDFDDIWRHICGKLWTCLMMWPAYALIIGGTILMFIGIPVSVVAAEQESAAMIVGILLTIIGYLVTMASVPLSIILSFNYVLTTYILIDNPQMKAKEAVMLSKQLMKGHKAEWFMMLLSFLGWDLLTSLTFGILSIYTMPYKLQTQIGYYLAYKNNAQQNQFGQTTVVDNNV